MRCLVLLAACALVSSGVPAQSTDEPELIQITRGGTAVSGAFPFGISDDGRRIAWIRPPEPPGVWKVFVGNEDGTNVHEVIELQHFARYDFTGCAGISLSGDGRTIAFASRDDLVGANPLGSCQIYLVDSDGTGLRQLTTHRGGRASHPALNRDGSVVAYEWGNTYLYTIATRRIADPEPVTFDLPESDYDELFDPIIDSSGDHIAFQWLGDAFFAFGTRAANIGDTYSHQLTPAIVQSTLLDGLSISRDGSTVLYLSAGNFTGQNPGSGNWYDPWFQAFVMPWEGGAITQLTDGTDVHEALATNHPMLADGSRAVLFLQFVSGGECELEWVDTRTGSTEEIFPRSAATCADGPAEVSADGRVLAFSSKRVTDDNPDGFWQLFVLRYGPPPAGAPPVAAAGPDQSLECEGDRRATALLDGSASSDPDSTPGTNDDIASYVWSEGGESLASGEIASVPFSLGGHDVTLTVTDTAGATGSDDAQITVQDTMPPFGSITAPAGGACFGPASLPVAVADDFRDLCEPTVLRNYDPAPGPSYSAHGDYHVTLTVADASGNAAVTTVDFTIDTQAPAVTLVSPVDGALLAPSEVPLSVVFHDSDDDQATGGVVHEVIKLDGCPIFDGLTYGNEDGLLSDESIAIGSGELCRAAAACGFTVLNQPVLSVEATDCGGNVGVASHRLAGAIALRPGICGE